MQTSLSQATEPQSVRAAQTLAAIDQIIAAHSVLAHPFYQAWQEGTLTRAALADYAAQYYHHVAAFPTYLSALHSRTDDAASRQVLLENLIDEERGTDNHPELWLRFAEGVGSDRDAVLSSQPQPQTRALIETFQTVTREMGVAAGIAALYAYESQIPEVAKTKMEGLRRFYGISDERTLAYFEVHATADVKHAAEERALLSKHIQTAADATEAAAAAQASVCAVWNLLSDICLRHGIACSPAVASPGN